MTSTDLYRNFLNDISSPLKSMGFKKRGDSFYLKQGKNYAFINFQRSIKHPGDRAVFTVNLGLFSYALWEFFSSGKEYKTPRILDCHWSQRLGFLLGKQSDEWWEINPNTKIPELVVNFEKIFNQIAVPKLRRLIVDEALQEYLAGENSLLETSGNRLYYLGYFLKKHGQDTEFEQIAKTILNSDFKPPEARIKAEKTLEQIRKIKGQRGAKVPVTF